MYSCIKQSLFPTLPCKYLFVVDDFILSCFPSDEWCLEGIAKYEDCVIDKGVT